MDELDYELDRFTPGAVEQALKRIGRRGSGALLVTSGLRDIRLVIETGRASVEAAGLELIGDEEPDLIRAFLCCLFWEDPSYFLDLEGAPTMSAPDAIRIETDTFGVISQLGQGFGELLELRERVPGLDVLVAVSGEPPPPDVDTPSANLFRVLERSPGGGFLLSAADEAHLDAIDAAWAVSDLLDAGQATVKQPPPTTAQRRLKAAAGQIQDGILPPVRAHHVAMGVRRVEPKRAAHHFQEAGDGFLIAGKPELALEEYGACLQAIPEHPLALEGRIRALEALGRSGEAVSLHQQLAGLYGQWALPQRTREHLEALPKRTPEQQDQLLNCMLLEKDFGAAERLARRLLPDLDAGARQALVARFGEAGARGDDLQAVVGLAGLQRARPVKRLAFVLTLLTLLATGLLAGEIALRQQFAIAARRTDAALEAGDFAGLTEPWQDLLGYARQADGVPLTCLQRVPPLVEALDRIEQDAERLRDPDVRAAFAWDDVSRWPDVRAADAALQELQQAAVGEPLRRKVEETRRALAEYRAEVEEAVEQFNALANRGATLRRAKELLARYPNALDLLVPLEVPLLVEVSPHSDATTVDWVVDGLSSRAARLPNGSFEVRLPVRPGARGTLTVRQPDHVPQSREVVLDELIDPDLRVDLIRWGPIASTELVEQPRVAEESGVIAVERFENARELPFAFVNLQRTPPGEALDFLTELLRPGERLIVQPLSVVRAGGAIYLERFNLWLSDRRGRAALPHKVDLSRKPIIPGVRRDITGLQSQLPTLDPLSGVRGFERIRVALEHTVRQMQEGLR